MGYYTGSGVTVGGGRSTRTLKSFYEWGEYNVRQKCISETKRFSGVSESYAKSQDCTDNLTAVCGGSGDLAWIIFDAEGTRTVVSYSRISDSNLFELTVTTETLSAYLSNRNNPRNLTP